MPRRSLAALAAALLLAACSTGGSEPTPTTSVPDGSAPATTGDTGPTSTSVTTTPPTTLPPGTEELPEEVRQELAELIAATEEVRQLEFLEQPNVVVVSDEELADRVQEQLEEALEDLPADAALYRLLGLIEPDLDLAGLYTELYREAVAGFYDGEVRELVVPRSGETFSVVERATLVHELAHALTDQHFEFHGRYLDMIDNDRLDEASAYQALIEGDATYAELTYLQGLSPEEQGEYFAEAFEVDTTVYDSAPRFIRDALLFPYDSGFIFVDHLAGNGGLAAIADAYASPPVSTEQIMDPADFPADGPVTVDLAPVLVDGYDLEYESTWGELGFTLMFDQFLSASTSATAAGGWGGDTYQVIFDGTEVILVLRYRGDSAGDAEELAAALREYVTVAMDVGEEEVELAGGSAFRGEDHAWVRLDGSDVYFVATSASEPFEDVVTQSAPVTSDTTATTGG